MYVFTQHRLTVWDAPVVCLFMTVPTTEAIAFAVTNQIPDVDYKDVQKIYDDEGIGAMLKNAETRLQAIRDQGKWPSIEKKSKDGKMMFAFQWITV